MLRGLRRAWPITLLIAAPFIFFWPATTGEVVLTPGDALLMFAPLRQIAMRQVAGGELPLWNPWVFSGFPLLGCMIAGVLYPLTWLYLVLPAPLAANLGVQLTHAAAGLTTYAYARAIGATRPAALLGGLTFAICGFAVSQVGSVPLHQGIPWLPLLLLALERLRREARAVWVATGAVAVALPIFAGHPQIPIYSLMVASLYATYFTVAERPSVGRRRYAAHCAALLLSGLALAAAQLLPTAELAAESVRTALPYDAFVEMALSPLQIPGLVFPRLFSDLVAVRSGTGAGSGGGQAVYVGVVPLMLAAAALHAWRVSAHVRFWALLAGVALLLCLGDALPPLARLMYDLPVYNLVRIPNRNLFELHLAIAVLAALGLSAAERAPGRVALRRAARAVGLVMASVAALWVGAGAAIWGGLIAARVPDGLAVAAASDAFAFSAPSLALPLLSAALAVVLFHLLAPGVRWPIAGLIALLCIDAVGQGPLSQLAVPAAGRDRAQPWVEALRHSAPAGARVLFAGAGGTPPADERPTLAGLRLVAGYDSLLLARYSAFARMDYAGRVDAATLHRSPVLDLLHTGHLALAFPNQPEGGTRIDRFAFAFGDLPDTLRPGDAVEFPLPAPRHVGALGAITMLGEAVDIPDGTAVARITLTDARGEDRVLWLRAGTHTAEWAWDRADVAARVRHRRAPVARDFPGGGFPGHRYAAELRLAPPIDAVRVRVESVAPAGVLRLTQLTLYDPVGHRSTALTDAHRTLDDGERWQRRFIVPARHRPRRAPASVTLPWSAWRQHPAPPWRQPAAAGGGWVVGLENRRALPRAWLVSRTLPLPADAVLASVHSGRLPDGGDFDPRTTALVEAAPRRDFGPPDPHGSAAVVVDGAGMLELHTRAGTAAFLVVSEIFYPGWTATIDGAPTEIVRTNYVLRGVELPAGEHRVRFTYRPRSVYAGLAISALAAAVLAAAVWRPTRGWRAGSRRSAPGCRSRC